MWKATSFLFNKYTEMGDCCLFIVIFRIKKAESWQPHARMGKWGSFSFQNVLFLRVEDSFLIWLDKTRQFKCYGDLVNNSTQSFFSQNNQMSLRTPDFQSQKNWCAKQNNGFYRLVVTSKKWESLGQVTVISQVTSLC